MPGQTVLSRPRRGLAAILLAAVLAIFAQSVAYEFVTYDDGLHVYGNRKLETDLTYFWKNPHEGLYIPVTYSLWGGLARLAREQGPLGQDFKYNPAWFHAASVVVHAANAGLVLSLLVALGLSGNAALAGALLFAAHPLQAESVAWVSEFKGLVAGFFSLAALRLYVAWAGGQRGRLWIWLSASLMFALALLSKPSAAAVPLLALALDRFVLGRPWRRAALGSLPWLLLVLPLLLITKNNQPDIEIRTIPPLLLRPMVYLDALAFYLGKLAWPAGLAGDYGRKTSLVLGSWRALVMPLLPVSLGTILWLMRRRAGRQAEPWIGAFAVFCLGFLPVSGLVAFSFQFHSTVADRYAYLPLLGVGLAVALAWERCGRTARAVLAPGLAILAVLCAIQVQTWQSNLTLYSHSLGINPRSYLLLTNYGLALADEGRQEEALVQYHRALCEDPLSLNAYINVGVSLMALNRADKAAEAFQMALELQPMSYEANLNLGCIYSTQGKAAESAHYLGQAVALRPYEVQPLVLLAKNLADQGRHDAAIPLYERALGVRPNHVDVMVGLCLSYLGAGRIAEALPLLEHLLRVVAMQPHIPELHHNLAAILARLGRLEEAEVHLREALRLRPGFAESQSLLAQILAIRGVQ